jgi:hypothetical protein
VLPDWDGREWQDYCTQLLYLHHDGQYQPIPDEDGGDGGLEGFSTDGTGCAYQCHAPKSTYGIAERRDRQITKIKGTVKKLIDNRNLLAGLIGPHTVCDVRFLFPACESRELVEEVRTQEARLRAAVAEQGIAWLAADVTVSAHQGSELLSVETARLARAGAAHARLPPVEVGDDEIDAHLKAAAEELTGAHAKLVGRFGLDAAPQLMRTVLKDHLAGKELAAHLSATNPTIHEEYERLVAERRDRIFRESLEGSTVSQTLTQVSDELAEAIVTSVPGVHHDDGHKLAQSAVADWLIECPLRFGPQAVPA